MIIVEGIEYISIPVTNPEASADFYADLFDFEVIGDTSGNTVRLVLDPYQLQLVKLPSTENPVSTAQIPAISFAMDVDDFTEAINEIESKEISIVRGPEANGKGGESLLFADPDNNLIEIFYSA